MLASLDPYPETAVLIGGPADGTLTAVFDSAKTVEVGQLERPGGEPSLWSMRVRRHQYKRGEQRLDGAVAYNYHGEIPA